MKLMSPPEFEAGTDEAGRGCLAGPVTAAAVLLKPDFNHPKIHDSKKLSLKIREELESFIKEKAIAYHIIHLEPDEIDRLNILQASVRAMQLAVLGLSIKPNSVAVDGNYFHPLENIPHRCIIGGDGKYAHIAAASILAKTARDKIMLELHEKYPMYDWNSNKGYPTQKHRNALVEYGPSPFHRRSFNLKQQQVQINLSQD